MLTGNRFGAAVAGSGYLEMTGYAKATAAPIQFVGPAVA